MTRRKGKFEDDLDEVVFGLEPTEDSGEDDGRGWVGLMLNVTKSELMAMAKALGTAWSDVRADLNRGAVVFPIYAVCTESSDGFANVYYFASEDAASEEYHARRGHNSNPPVRKMGNHVHSWFSAATFLNGKDSRKLGNNTVVKKMDGMRDGPIAVYLHRTPVVEYSNAGHITLRSGGWRTVTTKQRINQLLPPGWRLDQTKFEWTVLTPDGVYDFHDGISFDRDGKVVGAGSDEGYTGNPTDEQGREFIELEPNWHNMGQWALDGLSAYVGNGKVNWSKVSKADRKSVVALLATACACSYYVQDIGTDLLLLLGEPEPGKSEPFASARGFVGGHRDAWNALRGAIARGAERGEWGLVANRLSEAIG